MMIKRSFYPQIAVGALIFVATTVATAHVSPLFARGNQIVNSNGNPVLLRGVDCASMEWTSDGQGHILKTVEVAIHDWHANIIRLPLCQDRWFGKAPEQHGNDKPYRALIHKIVNECIQGNCYIVLDMHWNDEDQWGKNIGQHKMPDMHTAQFWRSFSPVYKNIPNVIFDLYNEPHNVSWNVWRNGGMVTEKNYRNGKVLSYKTPGMQKLLNIVRGSGAKNLILAGGLDWAYDMTGILNGYALKDTHGHGVAYANHDYNNKNQPVSEWVQEMEAATAKVPVIVSEFGGQGKWLKDTMAAMKAHHWNWIAWDLHPQAGPDLISDWNYTPTSDFGTAVKKALAGR